MEISNKVKEFFTSFFGRLVITVIGIVVIYGILMAALASNHTAIMVITWVICAVLGWRALNKITPNLFLIGNMNFWIMYFLIKGIIAICIGALIAPFQISKIISDKIAESLSK